MTIISIGDYVRQNAVRFPAKTALIDGVDITSYLDLDLQSDSIAAGLRSIGIQRGDRIAILAGASANWVRIFFGIVKSGAIATCLNYRDTPDRLAAMIRDVGASHLFVDDKSAVEMRGQPGIPEISDIDELTAKFLFENRIAPRLPSPEAEDSAVILFTGGTTGVSKGVLLSHRNIFWNVINEILDTRMSEWDTSLIATALHHSAALNTWLLPHLYLGATVTILREFDPGKWVEIMQRDGVTNGFTPPTMARQIIKHPSVNKADWSKFARWYSGAGILPGHEREAMEDLIPGLAIYFEYGLTEAGPIVTCLQPEDYDRAPNSIGRVVRHCEIKILNEAREALPAGEIGEIAVRGPAVMPGYFGRSLENDAVFHEGWLLTGDLAASDDFGFLTFHDRSKDMIKTGGLNVYSQEVENALSQHTSIREVAVIGISDDHWGEKVTAVVTLHSNSTETSEDIIAFARDRLGGYQVPKEIVFMDFEELPKNYLGKTLKRKLRDALVRDFKDDA